MNSILLADDHVLFREGLRSLIGHWQDFTVVGEAGNGAEAVALARELLPDIILMDITMPVQNGIEAARQIARELPATRIVMLTVAEEPEYLFQALKNGAHGYVLKDTPSRRLHDLLRGVLRGESPLSGIVATLMLDNFKKNEESRTARAATEPLAEREQQVLELVVQGLTNAEIALRLFLSENTVKKYLRNILQKFHLNSRVEAAVFAVREGMVEQPKEAGDR
jgi:DNA-binding NarL/FixJ family response regulator